jgi:hypothetical protein
VIWPKKFSSGFDPNVLLKEIEIFLDKAFPIVIVQIVCDVFLCGTVNDFSGSNELYRPLNKLETDRIFGNISVM